MESLKDSRGRDLSESGSAVKTQGPGQFFGNLLNAAASIIMLVWRCGPEDSMRADIRRIAGVVATIVIALHTILWAAVAPFAAPAVDPFTVICHSEASGPADQAPADGALAPAHACDHCNLCSVLASPEPHEVRTVYLDPVRVLQVLRPASVAPHGDVTANAKLARGPPALA
jgi:hypothetical protein